MLWAAPAPAQAPARPAAPAWDTFSDTWVGEDALGRKFPTYADVGPPRPNRQVGTFYFLWVDGSQETGPYDATRILAQDPDALKRPDSPLWPPGIGGFVFHGQPLFGYYQINDPFILRKHAQMLRDAGVKMLLFDASNSFNYLDSVDALSRTFRQIRAAGMTTPGFAFQCYPHSGAGQIQQVRTLYDAVYKPGKSADLWFRWQGKPLIIADPDPALGPEILNFFTFRKAHWLGLNPGPGAWDLGGIYPSAGRPPRPDPKATAESDPYDGPKYVMRDAQGRPEQMGVETASSVFGVMSEQRPGNGRSWHGGADSGYRDTSPGAVNRGIQFQDEWDSALKIGPEFVLNYCWNEWVAQKYGDKSHVALVDEFSDEFSKDIEPMAGGFGDDYYYQMVENDRRYLGVRPLPPVSPRPIPWNGTFDAWRQVTPEFRDDIGDTVQRDFAGATKNLHYVNRTGRNDIVAAKVSYDAENIYFYVHTHAPLTPHTDPDWMLLYLNTDGNYKTGWLGYDFVVNRRVGAKATSLEKNIGGKYVWQTVGEVKYEASGSQLAVAIPRRLLGTKALPKYIDFKWADHCCAKGDWTDFTLNGDAAPNDRFNYRAKLNVRRREHEKNSS